jgi:parallel beta-helix repeat protein
VDARRALLAREPRCSRVPCEGQSIDHAPHALTRKKTHMRFQSLSVRRLVGLLSASALVATMAVAGLTAAPVSASGSGGSVIFDNTAAVLPSNLPSFGAEAYFFNEWGGGAGFAGTARSLSTATVTMSSWACQTGSWTDGTCVTTPGATYSAPVTFNVYNVSGTDAVGSLIASRTQTFQIPFRPSYDSTNCAVASGQPGLWFDGTSCKNGLAVNIVFTFSGQTLPNNAIFGIAYNTDTNGYVPLAGSGSPLDSLNIAVYPAAGTAAPSVGSWLSTQTYAATNLPTVAFSGPRTGTFADGYEPAVQITALPVCTPTGFFRDGINLTAAQIGGTVTGTLDATGCNIGAYNPTNVAGATIYGANYFGVVANGGSLNVTNSTIRNIGEVPFNGSQHGIGIFYTGLTSSVSGTISGNTVSLYQKGGIVARDGAKVTISNNIVTGQGPINYIAQNGIQVSFGASARVFGNNVSLNNYSPSKVTACGLLIYQAGGVSGATKAGIAFIKADNNFHNNETDICNVGKGGGYSF